MRERESRWVRATPWRERGELEGELGLDRVSSKVKEDRFP